MLPCSYLTESNCSVMNFKIYFAYWGLNRLNVALGFSIISLSIVQSDLEVNWLGYQLLGSLATAVNISPLWIISVFCSIVDSSIIVLLKLMFRFSEMIAEVFHSWYCVSTFESSKLFWLFFCLRLYSPIFKELVRLTKSRMERVCTFFFHMVVFPYSDSWGLFPDRLPVVLACQ